MLWRIRKTPGPGVLAGVLAAGLLCGSWGCVAPRQPTARTAALVPVADGEAFERLWDASVEVLHRYRFVPTRQDRGAGVIQTRPVTSQSWFEFWRHDVADPYSFAEANLHTMRRTASIKMDRSQEPDKYLVSVFVEKERLSMPERQVTSSAGAIQMFGSRLPTSEGEMISADQARSWNPLGRDEQMEARLLRAIVRAYSPVDYEFVEVVEAADQQAPSEPGDTE